MSAARRAGLLVVLFAATASCGGGSGADFPAPGWERGGTPLLDGARVLVLPVQEAGDAREELDHELAFALRSRAPLVDWAGAGELAGTTANAGRLGADPRDLAVGVFGVGEVRRVGDPLYGDLYRLAAFVDADLVVLPLRGWWEAAGDAGDDGTGAVHLHAALLAPRTGRVLWQGVVRGDFVPAGSPAGHASVAERLAQRLVP